jgi:hypothetical protein
LGQRHTDRATGEPYESGITPTGSARLRLSADFYLIAMFFVIFDLEAVHFRLGRGSSGGRLGRLHRCSDLHRRLSCRATLRVADGDARLARSFSAGQAVVHASGTIHVP